MISKALSPFLLVRWTACLCFLVMVGLNLLLFGLLLQKTLMVFQKISLVDFIAGTVWRPTVTSLGECLFFGSAPILLGTLWVGIISLFVVGPLGILAAIYLSEYASSLWRQRIKVTLEFFSGIPSIVYGVFTGVVVAPLFQGWGETLGIQIAAESALVVGSVVGLMNMTFVVSLADEILVSIPLYMRRASWALGSTKGETIRFVVLPASFPGLMAVLILALTRSIGDTMVVVMAASLTAHWSLNPLESVSTITAQISSLLTGDQSPDSPKTQAAFALGLLIFLLTLGLNWGGGCAW